MHVCELWRPLYRVQEGKYTRESKRMTLSRIASCCKGDEEERNCDKGCWQAVTGTTLSATRFCAYHSPRVYHHRRQCRPRPIWSDLILVTLIHHPLSIRHLPSFTILLDLVVLCICRARFSISPLLVVLVFLRYPTECGNFDSIPKIPFRSANLKISIYSMSTRIVKTHSVLSSFTCFHFV